MTHFKHSYWKNSWSFKSNSGEVSTSIQLTSIVGLKTVGGRDKGTIIYLL